MAPFVTIAMLLRSFRWAILVTPHIPSKFIRLMAAFGMFFMLMVYLPFRAGDLSKVIWAKINGGSASLAGGMVVVEKFLDFVSLFLLLGIVGFYTPDLKGKIPYPALLLASSILIVYFLLIFNIQPIKEIVTNFLRSYQDRINPEEGKRSNAFYLSEKIVTFLEGMALVIEWKKNLRLMLFTLIIWGMLSLGYCFYLIQFFPSIPYSCGVIVLIFVNLSNLFGFAPGNFGLYEISAIAALSIFGIPFKTAIIPVIGLHLTTIILYTVYGLICKLLLFKMEY